jgi:chromatin remodeling complex protein RSC6
MTEENNKDLETTEEVEENIEDDIEDDGSNKKLDPLTELSDQFDEICQEVASIKVSIGSVMSKLRLYKKLVEKTLKDSQKIKRQKKKNVDTVKVDGGRGSGIHKPAEISVDLCNFLNKPKNTIMARTDVTKEIHAYIRENKLQDQNSKLRINADTKLKKLLRLNDNEELTFLNLQKYLNLQFA